MIMLPNPDMAVHSVTLSSEQAVLLMPVLQQLTAHPAPSAPIIQQGSNKATVLGSATGADSPSFTIQGYLCV